MSAFQAIGDGATPQAGLKFPGFGTIARPCLAFPPATAVNNMPTNAQVFTSLPQLGGLP